MSKRNCQIFCICSDSEVIPIELITVVLGTDVDLPGVPRQQIRSVSAVSKRNP